MQVTSLAVTLFSLFISSLVSADEVITSNGETITYVDITTTPEVTVSALSTVLTTSTPRVTTTISHKESSAIKSTSTKVTLSPVSSNITSTTITKSHVTQETKTITSCSSSSNVPGVAVVSDAGAILDNGMNSIIGLVMLAGLSLL